MLSRSSNPHTKSFANTDPDTKPDADAKSYADLNGNILPLTPGTTFFQLVPLGFDRLFVAEK